MELCTPTHPPSLPQITARAAPQPLLCRGHSHLSSRAGVSLPLRQHVMQTTRPQLHHARPAGPSAAGSTHSQLSSLWQLSAHEGLTCSSRSSSHLGNQSDSAGCSSGASTTAKTAPRCRQANVMSSSNSCKPSRNVSARASSSPRLWTRLTHTSRPHPVQVPQQTVQTDSWVSTEQGTTQNFLWGPQHPASTRPSRELPHHTYLPGLAFASGDSAAAFTSLFRPTSPGSTAAEVQAFHTKNNPPPSAHSTTYPDSSVVSIASAEQFNTTTSPSSQSIASLNNRSWGDSTATAASAPIGGSGAMAAQAADFATTHRLQRCTNWYELRALLTVIGPLSLNHVHIAALLSTLVRSVTYTIGPAERVDFDRFVIQSLLGARNAFTQMTPVELSITIRALGKLGVRLTSSPQLASLLVAVTHPQLHEFTGKELAWLAWGLGRTCTGRAAGSDETSRADTLGSGGGYGTEAVYLPATFLQTLSDELVARFPVMNTQDLANVAVGLTLLLPPASASRPTQTPHLHPTRASTVPVDDEGQTTAQPDQLHNLPSSSSSSNREDSDMLMDDSSSSVSSSSSGISSSADDDSSSSSRLHSSASAPHPDHIHTTNGSSPSQASAHQSHNPTAFQLPFWHAFAAASKQSLPDCTPQALANIIHALAHAAYPRSKPWVQRFQTVTHAQLPIYNAQSLATMLGAMHQLGVMPQPKWWQSFLAAASEPTLLQAATPQDLAELSMAIASISLSARSLHSQPDSTPAYPPGDDSSPTVDPAHNHQQPSLNPSNSSANGDAGHHDDSSSGASSSSTHGTHRATSLHEYASSLPPFLAAFDQCIENRAHNLPPSTLSTCLASMARLSHTPSPGTLHAWLASAGKQLPLFQPRHIAHTFWALATLRLAPPGRWMNLAVAVSKEGLPAANARELALTIWSFHRLEYLPSWQWLLEWGQSTSPHLRDMNPRDLGMVLHSASRLRWRPPAKWLATATDAAMAAVCISQRSTALRDATDGQAGRHAISASVLGLQMSCILCGLRGLRSTPQLPQLLALSDVVMGQLPSYSLRHTSAVMAVLAEWFQPPRLHRTVSEQYSRSRNSDSDSDSSRPQRATQQRRHRRRIRLALSVSLRRGSGPNSDAGSGFPALLQHKLHPLASLLQPAARPGSVPTPLAGLTGTRSRLATVPAPPTAPPRGLFNRGMASEAATPSELEAVAERARRTMSELEGGLRTARKHKEQLGRNLLMRLLDTTLPVLQSLARQPDSAGDTTVGQHSDSETQPQQADRLVIGQVAMGDASSEDRANPGAIEAATSSSDVLSVIRLLNTVCVLQKSQPSAEATSRVLQQLLSSKNTPVYQSPSRANHPAIKAQQTWLNTLYSVIDPHVMRTLPADDLLMLVTGVRATTCRQPPPSAWVTALLVASVNACALPEISQEASNARPHNGKGVHSSGNSTSSQEGGQADEHDWSRESAGDEGSSSSGRSVGSRKPLPKLAITGQVALLFSVSLIVAQQPPNQRKRQHRDVGKQLALKVMYNAMSTPTVPTLGFAAKVHAAAISSRFRLAHRPQSKAHTAQPDSHPPEGHTTDAAHWARYSPSLLEGVEIERAWQRKQWKDQQWYQHLRWLRLHKQGAKGASAAGRFGMKGAKLTPTQVGHLATAVALLLGPAGLFLIDAAPERKKVYQWLLRRLQLAAPRMIPRQRALLPAELMQAIKERGSTLGPKTLF